MVLVDVSGDDDIHRQSQSCCVEAGDGENTPRPQRLQDEPEEGGVARQKLLDDLHVYVNDFRCASSHGSKRMSAAMRSLMLGVSRQQLQGVRQQFDHRFQRLDRSLGTPRQIQDQ